MANTLSNPIPADMGADLAIASARRILGNPTQVASERIMLQLLDDPDVRALRTQLAEELAAMPLSQSDDAADRIELDILQWTAGLILEEINLLRSHQPDFIVGTDTSPRRWFGHSFPGTAKGGDNPDVLSRTTILDGRGRYEVIGQVDPAQPLVQLLFSLASGTMVHPVAIQDADSKRNPDAGIIKTIGFLKEHELKIAPDGMFRILVGGEDPGDGTPHLRTEPVACSFGCRQMLLDWTTMPLRLSIRRLDAVTSSPLDVAAVKRAVLADLLPYGRFWASFSTAWLGGLATNTSVPPAPRDGGWGFIAGVNFKLEPGQAALITVRPGTAKYMSAQITDHWMIGLNNARIQSTLNLFYSTPDADGRYTYILSPVDPGIANWLDTGGLNEGRCILRWQGFPEGSSDGGDLFEAFHIIQLSDVEKYEDVARITPEQRSHQLATRRKDFASRYLAE